jgi:hypothetical protein
MGNFFSSPWFLEASAEILFAGSGARARSVELQGHRFEVLLLPDGAVLGNPMSDFLEPCAAQRGAPGPSVPVGYLPRVALERVAVGGDRPEGSIPSPCIDWRGFSSWEDFVAQASARDWRAFKVTRRKRRKLGRERGAVRVDLELDDHALVERALIFKARQLRRTGRLDRFVSPRTRQLVHRLVEQGQLRLAVLWAGARPLAFALVHWGQDRLYSWITSYDPEASAFSPGTLLYEALMEASFARGQVEFDFLIGAEPYKYHYATHERLVGPLGRPPLPQRLVAAVRQAMEVDARPRRLRRASYGVARMAAEHRLANQPWASLDDRAYRGLIEAHEAQWPRLRLVDPGDCQIAALMHRAGADAGPLASGVARTRRELRRARRLAHQGLRRAGAASPADPQHPPQPLRLRPGERVRVKSPRQIEGSLVDGATGGLGYRPLIMARHAGAVFEVARRVGPYYNQGAQRVVSPEHGVVLAGVVCDGAPASRGGGCDRGCELFWSEAWLERVEAGELSISGGPEGPSASPSAFVGRSVRVRSLEDIQRIEAEQPDPRGLRFAPATMAGACGGRFQIAARVGRVYDAWRDATIALDDVFILAGLACPGAALLAAGACDRRCALLWRGAWLEDLEP